MIIDSQIQISFEKRVARVFTILLSYLKKKEEEIKKHTKKSIKLLI